MNNCVWSLLFLFSFQKVFSHDQLLNILRDKLSSADLKAVDDNCYFSNDSDKRKILDILKYFTARTKESVNKTTLVEDPAGYCRSFRKCYECVKSMMFPCVWCHKYGCTDKPDRLCALAMTKINLVNSNSTEDLRFLCPHVGNHGAVLVPAGVRQKIKVKLHASDLVLYDKELICQLQFRDRVTNLKASIVNDVVYCHPVMLNTMERGQTKFGSMRLIWGGVQPFSNKIPITVYRCDSLAMDCESCRLIPAEYGCGWCSKENMCMVADMCGDLLKWNMNRLTCK